MGSAFGSAATSAAMTPLAISPQKGKSSLPPVTPSTLGIGSPTSPSPPRPSKSDQRPGGSSPPSSMPSFGASSASSSRSSGPKPGHKISECERQLASLTERFNQTLAKLAQNRPKSQDSLQPHIEGLVGIVTAMQTKCHDFEKLLSESAERSAFLLSRKTDISRQVGEAQRLVDVNISTQNSPNDMLGSQPLDRASELKRREISTKLVQVQKLFYVLKDRIQLLMKMCEADGENHLLSETLKSYQKTKGLSNEARRISSKVADLTKKLPGASLLSSQTLTTPTRRPGGRKPTKITALPISGTPSALVRPTQQRGGDKRKERGEKWKAVELSLQGLQNDDIQHAGVWQLPVVTTKPEATSQRAVSSVKASRDYLLPPSVSSSARKSKVAQKGPPMLSPPASLKTRSAWDTVSDLDRAKQVSLSMPQNLNEVTFAGSSREALERFSTTPEKVKESWDVTKLGGSPKPPSRQRSGTKESRAERSSEKKPTVAAQPPLPEKAPTNPFSKKAATGKSDAAAFPPMSKIPPKPVPTSSDTASLKVPIGSAISVKDAMSAAKGLSTALPGSAKKPFDNTSKSALFGMGGVGDSLFGKRDSSKTPIKQGAPLGSPLVAGSSKPDYRKILTDFYTKHNPAKVGDVDKHLTKYADKLPEMFAKLANKYKVPNPLQSQGGAPTSSSQASTFSSTPPRSGMEVGQSKPSPFASTNPPSAQPSPFGQTPPKIPGGPQSFFGGSSMGGAGGAPAPTPFGSPSPFTGGSSMTPSTPAFGQSKSPMTMQTPAAGQQSFAGKSPRDMLVAFYQQKNAAKVHEVDKLLAKYANREEELFRNLAKKYNMDPSVFGLPSAPPTPTASSVAFGAAPAPAAFGTSTPGFGQPSRLGGGPSPFGGGATGGGGFGQASPLGQGMSTGMSMSGNSTPFGKTTSSFGSASFGSLAQGGGPMASNPSPFGAPSPGFGGGGGGFEGGRGFSTPTPLFGAPRR